MIGSEWKTLVEAMRGAEYRFGLVTQESPVQRVEFARGLTDAEIEGVERRFGFRFPPDLRAFLQTALPCGPLFPDWRGGDAEELRLWLDVPADGVLFDVEHNEFWLDTWGPRPSALPDAIALARDLVRAAPRLIPVYGHRMMPDEPHAPGNPVFSVHQTDIILYGADLEGYLRVEFDLPERQLPPTELRQIRFWDPDLFQSTRWCEGPITFDNSRGLLP